MRGGSCWPEVSPILPASRGRALDTAGALRITQVALQPMTTATRLAEVAAADAFLDQPKTFDGLPPLWTDSDWGGEITAKWIIQDEFGAPVGELRFTAQQTDTSQTSLSLLAGGKPLWRMDFDSAAVCHSNPHDGHILGLPALVCGPHEHAWPINRLHVLSQPLWTLPYRRPLPASVRRLSQGLHWLADQINLTVEPDQRGFEGPTRSDLFDRGGQ